MLSRWQSTIVDERGNVQPLANLTVRNEDDQSLAKMWASPGTSQPLPDGMVQADGNGYAFFYARGGLYRITSVALGIDWRGVQIGAALVSIGDYGPGLEITERNQVFWRDGELYLAGAVLELPYTTTGDWGDEEGLFVAVGDQALRQDLSNDSNEDYGAGLVGYKPGITVREAIDGIKQRTYVSSVDFPSLQDALNSGEPVIHIPNGVYEFSESFVISNPALTEIRGDGDTVFDFSGSLEGLVIDSGMTVLPNPATAVIMGDNKIVFPPGADISKGDTLILWNPVEYSFSQYRTMYRDGFMAEVANFDTNSGVATILGVVPDCNLSSINTYKFNSNVKIRISGVRIIPPNEGTALKITNRNGVYLGDDLSVDVGGYTGIQIDRCYGVRVNGVTAESYFSDAYPIVISNCQNFTITGATGKSNRHSIGIGGSSSPGSVPNRDGIIFGCVLENDGTTGNGAADCHGNVVGLTYTDCVIKSMATLGGRDINYNNCTIYGRPTPRDGVAVFGSEIAGGILSINDCILVLDGADINNNFGLIDISCEYPTHNLYMNISGLTIKAKNTSLSNKSILKLALYSATFDKSFRVLMSDIIVSDNAALKSYLTVTVPSGTPGFSDIEESTVIIGNSRLVNMSTTFDISGDTFPLNKILYYRTDPTSISWG